MGEAPGSPCHLVPLTEVREDVPQSTKGLVHNAHTYGVCEPARPAEIANDHAGGQPDGESVH